jgi:hypothetical protein
MEHPLDLVLGPLGRLLCNLLCLDSLREIPPEGQMGDGDVLEHEVELPRALQEVLPYPGRHDLSLGLVQSVIAGWKRQKHQRTMSSAAS